jgi:DNA-binding CsgD family transcriptional regulator
MNAWLGDPRALVTVKRISLADARARAIAQLRALEDEPLRAMPAVFIAAAGLPFALLVGIPTSGIGLGIALGLLATGGMALAWRRRVRGDREALARAIEQARIDADQRILLVTRQYEWAVNDIANLRDALRRARAQLSDGRAPADPPVIARRLADTDPFTTLRFAAAEGVAPEQIRITRDGAVAAISARALETTEGSTTFAIRVSEELAAALTGEVVGIGVEALIDEQWRPVELRAAPAAAASTGSRSAARRTRSSRSRSPRANAGRSRSRAPAESPSARRKDAPDSPRMKTPVPAAGSIDLWARVGTDGMPQDLLDAYAAADWPRVRDLIPLASRGVYGRQTSQFRERLPLGVDAVLTQHRGWSAILAGDWDDLERCLASGPVDPVELAGLRDTLLAPLDREPTIVARTEAQEYFFGAWGYSQSGMIGRYRRLVRKMLGWRSDLLAIEHGTSASHHARHRRLQDSFLLALQESIGGRLDVAGAIAHEARELGAEGEALRVLAAELESAVAAARGGSVDWSLVILDHLRSPHGQTPVDASNYLLTLMPFFAIRRDDAFDQVTQLVHRVAVRLSAARNLLRAETWRLAAELRRLGDAHGDPTDLAARTAALLIKSRGASVGMRALPLLLDAIVTKRPQRFAEAERTGRLAGALWIQATALTWQTALNPDPTVARRLLRILSVSGWRRPSLVPRDVAADAALGMTAAGIRDRVPIDLAVAAGRPNIAYEVARAHLEDARTPAPVAMTAIEALARLGTTHARKLLHRAARRDDALGRAAAEHIARAYTTQLSEREVEVLDLAARGLTNKEIGARLSLSPHTVARHLANIRSKLGAANRAEAAARLSQLDR